MLIGILLNRVTWEIKQIIKELDHQGIDHELLNNKRIYFELTKKKDLEKKYDVILERSLSYMRGLYDVINNYECLNLTGNKLLTTLKLIENEIPTPKTCVAFKAGTAMEAIEEVMEYPAIVKPIIGSWGRLISKLEDKNAAIGNLECRETMGNILQKIYYLQEFIPTPDKNAPTDIRVIVIGDECVAAMGRFNPKGDFRSNIAIGGTAEPLELTEEIKQISVRAARAVQGEMVGVDLMEHHGSLSVIEVNGTPQFRGIQTSTRINVAKKMVDYLIDEYM